MIIRSFCLLCVLFVGAVQGQEPIDGVDARSNAAEFAKQLGSPDPHVRQRSAEALARLAAVDQRKLVQGYQLQEKNKEVRLALDWALYRMGEQAALYRVVQSLDSDRQEQAIGYLAELEGPDVLYPFLKKQNNAPRVNAGILKALARIGDAQSLELIKPFRDSHQPYVAEAAEIAHDEIEKRLGEPATPTRGRPRTVSAAGDRPR
ncbi:MAG TPA: HEAT repeat domain-containing protein [Pyrinomonadaceae bacterium]|nr:HEAT repeat domain-containing protein [Pyrinomonadaceae bacterium]